MTALAPEKLAEIKARNVHLLSVTFTGAPLEVGTVLAEDVPALIAEVERLNHAIQGGLDHVGDALRERDEARAEVVWLRNIHSSAWADVRALLAERRDSDWTDNELTNAVMALITREGGSK